MDSLKTLFGDTLIAHQPEEKGRKGSLSGLFARRGSKPTGVEEIPVEKALEGKERIGIYFSAHWCPPCKHFTPQLAKKYNQLVEKDGKPFEIIFVSSDKDNKAFQQYFKEMPWLAVPFENRDIKNKLSKKFKVSGIPSLVVVDANSATITTDGRSAVMEEAYPWTPKTLASIMDGTELLSGDGESVAYNNLKGKVLAFYFSAHWCPPCRGFTPQLVETYNKLKAEGKDFEIIFASSDRDMAAFQDYFKDMPWLAIPQGDSRKNDLSKLFGVEGIPMLVILDEEGKVITTKGRGAVGGDPEGKDFPWHPKPVADLSEGPGGLNEEVSLLVMCEGVAAPQKAEITKVLEPIALKTKAAATLKGEDSPFLFFTSKEQGSIAEQIRGVCKLGQPGSSPQMVLLDIPDDGGFYVSEASDITEASVKGFLQAYTDGKLTRQQLA